MKLPEKSRVVVVFGRAITYESLKSSCSVQLFPDGYADLLWRNYWRNKDAGQDRTGSLNELVKICFGDSELRKFYGKRIEEK